MHSSSTPDAGAAQTNTPVDYSERLWPAVSLFIVLLLLLPSVTLMLWPIASAIAIPASIVVYALVAGSLALMSPSLIVRDGQLRAGSARIPVSMLGETTKLNDAELRRIIGPGADARAYLLVRGYIHQGVRVEVTDPADPAPYWVLTTRRPNELVAAIEAARAAE